MKKAIIILAVVLTANTAAIAQDSTHKKSTSHQKTTTAKKYTCTMHPEVVMDKPGKCPKCGMTLVAVKSKKTSKKMAGMKM